MNATTVTIHINSSALQGEALARWHAILKRALALYREVYTSESYALEPLFKPRRPR